MALGIDSRGPFVNKMIAVPANEAVHPGVTHAVGIEVQGEISDHVSCWRQRSLCKVIHIAHELCFFMWVEGKLGVVLRFLRPLTALVSAPWCTDRRVKPTGNFAVSIMFSWFQLFNC
jgi:hypothetical protein